MKTAFAAMVVCVLAACSQTPSDGTSLASANARAAGAPVSQAAAPAPASSVGAPLPPSTTPAPAADAATVLTQYHWQLVDAVSKDHHRIDTLLTRRDRPLQLDFDAHGVSIGNTCNRMHGSYSVAGGKLTLGNFASTLMACNDPALTALDAAAGKYLQGTFALALEMRGRQPRLVLTADDGTRLTFTGTPTDAQPRPE